MALLESITNQGLVAGYLLLQLQCSFCHEDGEWCDLHTSDGEQVRQAGQAMCKYADSFSLSVVSVAKAEASPLCATFAQAVCPSSM